jgi:hypothetical protein
MENEADGLITLISQAIAAFPDDDRLFEAGLYAAQQLRRDGFGVLAAMLSSAITERLTTQRPLAPAFAAKYAPTDAEVFRLFATEAVFALRMGSEQDWPEEAKALAFARTFASAPTDRTAFVAFLEAGTTALGEPTTKKMWLDHASRQFESVDSYNAWLAKKAP